MGTTVYAMTTKWPQDGLNLALGSVQNAPAGLRVELVGYSAGPLNWRAGSPTGIVVTLPSMQFVTSKWAWTLRLTFP